MRAIIDNGAEAEATLAEAIQFSREHADRSVWFGSVAYRRVATSRIDEMSATASPIVVVVNGRILTIDDDGTVRERASADAADLVAELADGLRRGRGGMD